MNLPTPVRGLFQHGVRRAPRGEEKLYVSGAEAGRAPQEKTADEFGRQDEQNRWQRQKRVWQQRYMDVNRPSTSHYFYFIV